MVTKTTKTAAPFSVFLFLESDGIFVAKPTKVIDWLISFLFVCTARLENTTTDSELARRFDTRSKLTIRAQPDDNDAEYTCEARHPALMAPKRASVSLNVQCTRCNRQMKWIPWWEAV